MRVRSITIKSLFNARQRPVLTLLSYGGILLENKDFMSFLRVLSPIKLYSGEG